ncbi:PfkB family carbohydrate kinase [Martelella soudanensis]|uniref:PfkB family carbohydrate kinase n=1 Tax=unclassified Martelella TaxID=2629616 RepID=UPI0015DDDE9C|nr:MULTISPECIES: PfkB family carbohydrate kinase [unclassified Martelella]
MRAFVIGNAAIDETISVDGLPEPGVSILGRIASRDLGGKGTNQAVVMARGGLETTLVSATGDDFRADTIRNQLAEEPLDARLSRLSGISTDFSMVLNTPDGENSIVTTTEAAEALPLDVAMKVLGEAKPGDFLVMQGNLSAENTETLLKTGRERGMVTAFNPSPLRPYFERLWPFIDIVFLNESESLSLAGATGQKAAETLHGFGIRQVVLTAGTKGAMLSTAGGAFVHVPAVKAKAIDTTGAGDTFMGAALASAALRGGMLDERAISHASAASALTVARRGTRRAFPSRDELAVIFAG